MNDGWAFSAEAVIRPNRDVGRSGALLVEQSVTRQSRDARIHADTQLGKDVIVGISQPLGMLDHEVEGGPRRAVPFQPAEAAPFEMQEQMLGRAEHVVPQRRVENECPFHPIFERIDPLIAPIMSFMSPPRAVEPSWPILASIHKATRPKMTFAIHIETTAGISPRLAIDSPAIRHT